MDAAPLEPVTLTVEARAHGWRLDHYLTRLFPNFSRALFQKSIEQERVLVNGLAARASRKLRVNDIVHVQLPTRPDATIQPEDIPLDVIYEDEHLVAINKPAGLIVHPGRGNYSGTLCGALQFHFDRLSDAAGRFRPGIVHRLDRDTSGIILVAKDNQVHSRLAAQFEQREVKKEYRALAWGEIDRDSDFIETHVRINPRTRERMQVCAAGGNARHATTFYEVLERLGGFTSVRLFPKTGRTHQLRIHLQYLGHPIVADRLYGGRACLTLADLDIPEGTRFDQMPPPSPSESLEVETSPSASDDGDDVDLDEQIEPDVSSLSADTLIARQALHAYRIEFRHPATGEPLALEAPWPPDFDRTLAALRQRAATLAGRTSRP